jgi:hypothetical protein
MRLGDGLLDEQLAGVLDRRQRPLGILSNPREHPLTLGVLASAVIRLLVRLRVVELQRAIDPAGGIGIDAGDPFEQLLNAVTDQPHGVLGRCRPEHRGRVDDLLHRAITRDYFSGLLGLEQALRYRGGRRSDGVQLVHARLAVGARAQRTAASRQATNSIQTRQ